ncbi:MAG: hypothetical protein IPL61_15840 [Myxococcales bacterium]|nr:hypothetical protein [Myxococcales bacterium]
MKSSSSSRCSAEICPSVWVICASVSARRAAARLGRLVERELIDRLALLRLLDRASELQQVDRAR